MADSLLIRRIFWTRFGKKSENFFSQFRKSADEGSTHMGIGVTSQNFSKIDTLTAENLTPFTARKIVSHPIFFVVFPFCLAFALTIQHKYEM